MRKICLLIISNFIVFAFANAQIKTKQEKGYFNITNVTQLQYLRSIDSSIVDYGMAVVKGGFEAHTINGIFLNTGLSIGLGVGIQLAKIDRSYEPGYGIGPDIATGPDMMLLPIFADFRYYPKNSLNAPMFILDVGYAALLNGTTTAKNDLNGGPLVQLGAGYKFYLGDFISFVPSLNFRAQRFGENTVFGGSLGIGFIF